MMRGLAGLVEGTEDKVLNARGMLRRLGAELLPHKRDLMIAGSLVAVSATMQALGPWLVSRAIDIDIAHRDVQGLLFTLGCMLLAYIIGPVAQRSQLYLVGRTGQRILASLRGRLFAKFQTLPVSYFDKRPIGDLMSRVGNDVDTLNQLVSQGLTQVLGSLFALAGILIAMFLLNAKLAFAAAMVIPVMLLCIRALAMTARAAYRETRVTTGDVNAGLQEEIGGVREAQAFSRTDENESRFRTRNAANRDASIRAALLSSLFTPLIDVLATFTTALVIGYGAYLVLHGELSVGLLAAFMLYVGQFFWPLQLAAQVTAQFQSALAGAERIYAILDEPGETETGTDLAAGPGRIELQDVSFSYQPGRKVLKDISFVAQPGQTVAIVGPTGAGKTSIAGLLPRFYDVDAGAVYVDGQDVRSLSRASLRSRIGVVAQEPFLFSGTIAENLAYGLPDATRDQVEAMARAVGAHDFITALPQGYDTPLGAGGAKLGQGQRQLIAIARAMLADRPMLVLDEATSHVDAATEAVLQRALAVLMQGRTSIVIAHRLSTIRHADMILVVDAGQIVERGTHDALMVQGGLYARLNARSA